MPDLIHVEINTADDCILFRIPQATDGALIEIINCISLAVENYYKENYKKYRQITTENGGMILEVR